MKLPTVDDCKRLAAHYGVDGVLVLAVDFKAEVQAGASWGRDSGRCAVMGSILDDMIDELKGREPHSLSERQETRR